MNILDCHAMLAAKSAEDRQALLPGEYYLDPPGGRADCWPAAATAAVILATTLATLETERDLQEALQHFHSLLSIGVVEQVDLERETLHVVSDLMAWGWRESGDLAAMLERN